MFQLRILVVLISCLGLGALAFAQTQPLKPKQEERADSLLIEEVEIVKKRDRNRSTTGALVTETVSQSFLRERSSGSLMHTLRVLPGVQALTINSGQAKPMVRGLSFNQVLIIDEGIRHQGQEWGVDHGLEIDQYRIGLVEIVKGPTSFRYGSDGLGGAILLHPAPPAPAGTHGATLDLTGRTANNQMVGSLQMFRSGEKWYGDIRGTYNTYGDQYVPVDTLFVYDYAVALKNRRLRNTAGREAAVSTRFGYRNGRAHTWISANTNWMRSGFFANAHGLEPRYVDYEKFDASNRDIGHPSQEVKHWKLFGNYELTLDSQQLVVSLGFQRNVRNEENQYIAHGYMPPVFPDNLPFPSTLERHYNKATLAGRLEHKKDWRKYHLNWGLDGEFQNNHIDGWSFLSPALHQLGGAGFITGIYRVNERSDLHAGLRFDASTIHSFAYQDWFTSPPERSSSDRVYLDRAKELQKTFSNLTWSLGWVYSDTQLQYSVNLGKGFRLPLAKELAADGVNYHYFRYEKGDPNLEAETSYQLDMGFSWVDNRWSLFIDPFVSYFPNYIFLNPTAHHDYFHGAGNQIFQYTQVEVLRAGGEARFVYTFSPHLSAEVSVDWVYSRQLSGSKKGFALPFSPPATAAVNLRWGPRRNRQNGWIKQPSIAVDYEWNSPQIFVVPPEKTTPESHVVHLILSGQFRWNRQLFGAHLRVRNVLNTRYLNHLSFYRLIDLPEPGRNIELSLYVPFIRQK